jgi:tetratricopeptide (TPR) repeat protein
MKRHLAGGLVVLCAVHLAACRQLSPTPGSGSGSGSGAVTRPEESSERKHTPPRPASATPPKVIKAYATTARAIEEESSFSALHSAKVTTQARAYPKEQQQEQAPLSLTASDGTGLALESLRARASLEGPLALTELHLIFRNPEPRVIEGRFSITLPTGAAISRFAMKLPGGWQEAEVVERRAAQEAYEDFLHRRQDPALLEKKAGNEFSARIFPIPASGTKEIKITFSQELAAAAGVYRLPLVGLPKLGELEATLLFGKRDSAGICVKPALGAKRTERSVALSAQGLKPTSDFVVQTKGCDGKAATVGLRHDNLALIPLSPKLKTASAPLESLLVLFDTSASRAAGFAGQVRQLGALLALLGDRVRVQVVCFDQVVSPIYEGAASGFGEAQQKKILERRALGASNLHAALRWAGTRHGYKRLLLLSDGVVTAGVTEAEGLIAATKKLRGTFERVDALVVGGIRDEETLRKIVRGNLSWDGLVLDGDQPLVELARRLGQTTISGLEVDVPGARWVWPSRLDGVQDGETVLVYADLPAASAQGKPVTVTLSGPLRQTHQVELVAALQRPLLERSWIAAQIAKLTEQHDRADAQDDERRAQSRQKILALSIKHRVLSDLTALLVLETEADYARFNIDRKALADILTVGDQGVQLISRKGIVVDDEPAAQKEKGQGNVQDEDAPSKVKQAKGARKQGEAIAKSPPLPTNVASVRVPAGKGSAFRVRGVVAKTPAAGGDADGKIGLGTLGTVGRGGGGGSFKASGRVAKGEEGKMGVKVEARRRETRASADLRPAEPKAAPAARRARPRIAAKRAAPRAFRDRDPDDDLVDSDSDSDDDEPIKRSTPALTGKMAAVAALIKAGRLDQAVADALRWRAEDAGDVLALVALGDALKASGKLALAARAYGSIIDLFPSRADMRRFAGMELEALGPAGQALAADSFAEAVLQRPDHPNSHRLLGFALLRLGDAKAAFAALEAGARRTYPEGRFAGVGQILREDLGLVAAVWIAQDAARRDEIRKRLDAAGATFEKGPSLRFVLSWETDANDVDFHIHDGKKGHAYYSRRELRSGGQLYADVTTGYGPECFNIPGKPRAFPYRLQAHYYSRGPMGYGMGKLEIIQHDGKGGLRFEQRPYVVMTDQAYLDLGWVRKPL